MKILNKALKVGAVVRCDVDWNSKAEKGDILFIHRIDFNGLTGIFLGKDSPDMWDFFVTPEQFAVNFSIKINKYFVKTTL